MQVTIDGIDALLAALDAYPDIAGPILADASSAALLGVVPALADYPSPPAGSTYRRTGTLGRLWSAATPEFQTLGGGFEASIGNATPYGPWVQSAGQQASAHRGRWTTDDEAVSRQRAEIDRTFADALQQVADALDAKASG